MTSFACRLIAILPRRALRVLPVCAVAVLASFSASDLRSQELVTTSYGGQTEQLMTKVFYDPFIKPQGIRLTQVPMNGETAFARMQAERGRPSIDMFHFSGGQQVQAAALGMTTNVGDLGGAAIAPEFRDPNGQWVALGATTTGLLYNKAKVKVPPTSWMDLAKPEFKGRVAMPSLTNYIGPSVLVMLAKVNGGGIDQIDPGFAALKRIIVDNKAEVFDKNASLPMLFDSGEIWMVPYDAGLAHRLRGAGLDIGFVIPKEGGFANLVSVVIAKDAKNIATAQKMIGAFLTPDAQVRMAREMRWSPTNLDAKLPPDLAGDVLDGAALRTRVSFFDPAAIRKGLPGWLDRYNREIAGK